MSCVTLVNMPLNGCSYFQGDTIPETTFDFVDEDIDFTDPSVEIVVKVYNGSQLIADYSIDNGITVVDSDTFKIDEVSAANNNFPIGTSTGVYTLNTWEANGAITYVEADNTCDIYDIRFVVTRVHKAV